MRRGSGCGAGELWRASVKFGQAREHLGRRLFWIPCVPNEMIRELAREVSSYEIDILGRAGMQARG